MPKEDAYAATAATAGPPGLSNKGGRVTRDDTAVESLPVIEVEPSTTAASGAHLFACSLRC